MNINTDYAQYRDWGQRLEPQEKEQKKEDEPVKDEVKKKHVTLPGWLSKKRGKAKLWSVC